MYTKNFMTFEDDCKFLQVPVSKATGACQGVCTDPLGRCNPHVSVTAVDEEVGDRVPGHRNDMPLPLPC